MPWKSADAQTLGWVAGIGVCKGCSQRIIRNYVRERKL